jgi:hypothetical protein
MESATIFHLKMSTRTARPVQLSSDDVRALRQAAIALALRDRTGNCSWSDDALLDEAVDAVSTRFGNDCADKIRATGCKVWIASYKEVWTATRELGAAEGKWRV